MVYMEKEILLGSELLGEVNKADSKQKESILRDQFAGMAMQGWLASWTDTEHPVSTNSEEEVAYLSYAMADAMLAARKAE